MIDQVEKVPEIRLKVIRQGLPTVMTEDLKILDYTNKFIIGVIDLKHKWCFIESTFSSGGDGLIGQVGFWLSPTKQTREINGWLEGWDPEDDFLDTTEVAFESAEKLDIFMIECSRYTIKFILERIN